MNKLITQAHTVPFIIITKQTTRRIQALITNPSIVVLLSLQSAYEKPLYVVPKSRPITTVGSFNPGAVITAKQIPL